MFASRTDPNSVRLYNLYNRRSLSVTLYVAYVVFVAIAFVEEPAVNGIGLFPEWGLRKNTFS